ncbi:MAG: STAS domain-containing protein [Acutalibacteraceae bacterium]
MNIKTTKENNITTIAIDGRLDTLTSPELNEKINELAQDSDRIILDLTQLEYISSAGIRSIVSAHKLMADKGGFAVKAPNENVMEIITLTGISEVIEIIE